MSVLSNVFSLSASHLYVCYGERICLVPSCCQESGMLRQSVCCCDECLFSLNSGDTAHQTVYHHTKG